MGVSVAGLAAAAWAGDGTFATTAPGSPFAMQVPTGVSFADFNNDGNLDVVTSNAQSPGGLSIRLGAGDGTFPTLVSGSPFGTGKENMVAVPDLNGDGNLDVVAPDETPNNSVSFRIGDGTGSIPQVGGGSPLTTDINDPRNLAVGDFNRDGHPDLAITNFASGKLTVYLASASATFPTAMESVYTVMQNPRPVVVADFNGDGKEDLAVGGGPGGGQPGSIQVLLGDGSGGFTTAPGSPFTSGIDPIGLVAADLDNDGHPDIATVDDTTHTLSTYLGSGTGALISSTTTQLDFTSGPRAIAAGDFNSDGNVDLVEAGPSGAAISIGNGSGAYPASKTSQLTSGTFGGVGVGDFNNDGNVDLGLASGSSGLVVRLGGGTAPLAGNLLANGGFEGPGAARTANASPAPDVSGWQVSGGMTAIRYGTSPLDLLPHIDDSPNYLTGGVNMLWGGNTVGNPGVSSATQTVDVSGSAQQIDTGQGTAHLSAELGGGGAFDDRMTATASFLDGTGAELGSFTIGPVTAGDRHDATTLLPRAGDAAVPSGTRAIRVMLNATESDTAPTYAFADNVKLTLALPEVSPPPSPPPTDDTTPPTLRFSGKKTETLGKVVTVKVSADEACTADLTGSLKVNGVVSGSKRGHRFALKDHHVDLVIGAATKVKFKLSKKVRKAAAAARKRKAKIAVVAADASGNQGSAKISIRLR